MADQHRYEEVRETWTGELQGPPICGDCSREKNDYVAWPCEHVRPEYEQQAPEPYRCEVATADSRCVHAVNHTGSCRFAPIPKAAI